MDAWTSAAVTTLITQYTGETPSDGKTQNCLCLWMRLLIECTATWTSCCDQDNYPLPNFRLPNSHSFGHLGWNLTKWLPTVVYSTRWKLQNINVCVNCCYYSLFPWKLQKPLSEAWHRRELKGPAGQAGIWGMVFDTKWIYTKRNR